MATKIPTAEEFLMDGLNKDATGGLEEIPFEYTERKFIEFAKLHVQVALKAAEEKAKLIWSSEIIEMAYKDEVWVDGESILNAYPLENIK